MEINELITKAQNGETVDFGEIYDQYADRIFRFIRLKVSNQQQAEDILQEVFYKAWKGLWTLRVEDLNFSGWLYKVASNCINDYFRQLYRKPGTVELNENLDVAAPSSLVKDIMTADDLEQVKQALKKLTPSHRQVLELRFIQDFNCNETAKILNKSNVAVRLIQYRALKRLRKFISTEYAFQYSKI